MAPKPPPPPQPAGSPNPPLRHPDHHEHVIPDRPLIVDRRELLQAGAAVVCGGLAGAIPALVGLPVVLSPLLMQKESSGSGKHPLIRVATLESLPADGTPVTIPVISDKLDAWTREANQPIGAVFLRRAGAEVECFNAICPHAGCMVAYAAERKCFQCPCHTSQFELNGAVVHPSPSPRNMDRLTIDEEKLKSTGEIWVEFVNYYPGKADMEPKA